MKKFAISLVAILSVFVMALSFAACGASGKYKFESMTVGVGALSKTYEVGDEYLGTELSKDWFTLELKSDGTCSIKTNDSESAKAGTWTEEDGVVTFNVSGVSIGKATKDGNRITFDYGVMKITLKK